MFDKNIAIIDELINQITNNKAELEVRQTIIFRKKIIIMEMLIVTFLPYLSPKGEKTKFPIRNPRAIII